MNEPTPRTDAEKLLEQVAAFEAKSRESDLVIGGPPTHSLPAEMQALFLEQQDEKNTVEGLRQSLARVTAERDELQTERDWLKKQLSEVIKERDRLEELKAILTDDELAALCRKLTAERDELQRFINLVSCSQCKQVHSGPCVIESLKAERDQLAAEKAALERERDELKAWRVRVAVVAIDDAAYQFPSHRLGQLHSECVAHGC